MIFLTVGTAYPFDALVRACDAIAAADDDDWFAQIQDGSYEPRHMRFDRWLDRDRFDAAVADADLIVSHAGMGTISAAVSLGKPVLVVPRRRADGDHVNDHQVAGAAFLAAQGHVLVADSPAEVGGTLDVLREFRPVPRTPNPTRLAEEIGAFLRTC